MRSSRRTPRDSLKSGLPAGASASGGRTLSVSVVVYQTEAQTLGRTVRSLVRATRVARDRGVVSDTRLYLIDNHAEDEARSEAWRTTQTALEGCETVHPSLIAGHGNVGYGAAHNLALAQSEAAFHLVLNPDVIIDEEALSEAASYLDAHPEAGLVAPYASGPQGEPQHLCKRYPSVLVLAVRGFAPRFIRRLFQERLAEYEMVDLLAARAPRRVELVGGAFMFFRTAVLRAVGGFDPRFFLYFEDFDLSLRSGRVAHNVYLPSVKIIHYGGGTAQKGMRHVAMFVRSATRFFRLHGWRWI